MFVLWTVIRGEMGVGNGGKRMKVCRNNYEGHMDKTKGGGIRGGRWGWLGWGRSGGRKMQTTVLEQQ